MISSQSCQSCKIIWAKPSLTRLKMDEGGKREVVGMEKNIHHKTQCKSADTHNKGSERSFATLSLSHVQRLVYVSVSVRELFSLI